MSMPRVVVVVIFIFLPIAMLVAAIVGFGQPAWPIVVAALPPWMYCLFTVLYDWWDGFHFWINRMNAYYRNKQVDWEVRAEYQDFESDNKLSDIVSYLKKEFPGAEILVNEANQKIIRMESFPLHLRLTSLPFSSLDSNIATNFLVIDTMAMNHTFRRAQKLIEYLSRLFENIGESVNATEQKYEMQVRFDDGNPYFGFYVQRVKLPNVTRFDCEFSENVGGYKQTVLVKEKGITIITNSISSLTVLAKDYLSLTPMPNRDFRQL